MPSRKSLPAVALVCALAVAGCVQAKSGPISKKDFVSQYRSRKGVTKEWAQCVADQLFDNKNESLNLTTAERKNFNDTKPKLEATKSMERKAEQAGSACKAKGLVP